MLASSFNPGRLTLIITPNPPKTTPAQAAADRGGRGRGNKKGAKASPAKAAAADGADAAAPAAGKDAAQLEGLLQLMGRLAAGEGADPAAARPLEAQQVLDLVGALSDELPLLNDAQLLVNCLADEAAAARRGALGNAHLAALIAAVMERSAHPHGGARAPPRGKGAAAAASERAALRQGASVALMAALPKLLGAFQSEPAAVSRGAFNWFIWGRRGVDKATANRAPHPSLPPPNPTALPPTARPRPSSARCGRCGWSSLRCGSRRARSGRCWTRWQVRWRGGCWAAAWVCLRALSGMCCGSTCVNSVSLCQSNVLQSSSPPNKASLPATARSTCWQRRPPRCCTARARGLRRWRWVDQSPIWSCIVGVLPLWYCRSP